MVQVALLIVGIAMVCFGVMRGEADAVLAKAIRLQRSLRISICQTSPKAASTKARKKRFACRGLIAIRALRLRAHVLSVHFSRWWARPSSAFPITSRARSSCSACCWGALCVGSTKRLKPLTYIKYGVLLLAVVLLPVLVVNDVGMGDPFFCKYICPQGVLEGAIPLAAVNAGIRSALGQLFTWKLFVLIAVVVLSVLFYRPFCKWICPLGAFYALMNKMSLLGIRVDACKCAARVQRFARWTSMWSAHPIMPNVSGAESASGPVPSMPSAIAMAWMCRKKSSL